MGTSLDDSIVHILTEAWCFLPNIGRYQNQLGTLSICFSGISSDIRNSFAKCRHNLLPLLLAFYILYPRVVADWACTAPDYFRAHNNSTPRAKSCRRNRLARFSHKSVKQQRSNPAPSALSSQKRRESAAVGGIDMAARSEKIAFLGACGAALAARLDWPEVQAKSHGAFRTLLHLFEGSLCRFQDCERADATRFCRLPLRNREAQRSTAVFRLSGSSHSKDLSTPRHGRTNALRVRGL